MGQMSEATHSGEKSSAVGWQHVPAEEIWRQAKLLSALSL